MIKKILQLALALLVISTVASVVFDRPIITAYVTSNSMSPTIEKEDMILINPLSFLSNYETGDIIVFYANGKWVCHRIFAITEEGYITKGDANVATDQQKSLKPVQRDQIAGKLITVFGEPIVIPHVGFVIKTFSDSIYDNKLYAALVFLIIGSVYLLSGDSRRRKTKKAFVRIKVSHALLIFATVTIIVISFFSALMIEDRFITYGTTAAGNIRPEWVFPGQTFEREVAIENTGLYPKTYFVKDESERCDVEEIFTLSAGGVKRINVTIKAPPDTSLYSEKIVVAKYYPLLPEGVIYSLARVNYYLPILAIDCIMLLPYIFFALLWRGETYKMRWSKWLRRHGL